MISRVLTPFRVGLVVIGGVVAFLYVLSILGQQRYKDEDTYRLHATFNDASGLNPKSRITIAGIEVGVIERIELTESARARITLRLRKDIRLYEDARISKRSASLLGDFLLDVYPGDPSKPPLPAGGEVALVVSAPGAEDVFAQMNVIAKDLQKMTESLSELLASDQGVGSIRQIITSMNEIATGLNRTIESTAGHLDAILGDVEALSGDIRGVASAQQHNVQAILVNVRDFTDQANRLANTLGEIVGSNEGELKGSVASVRATLDEMQRTLKAATHAIESAQGAIDETSTVVAQVSKGDGNVGRLLRDDTLVKSLEKTAADVQALVKPLAELEARVHVREELHFAPPGAVPAGTFPGPAAKTIVRLDLAPRPDEFYGVELVADPRGNVRHERVTTTGSDGKVVTEERISTETDAFKFSAFFGRRFGPAAVRLGLIESTGGFGGDVFLLDDSLRVSADVFEFGTKPYPRLRASAQYSFGRHFYAGVGVDDPLNATLLDAGRVRSGLDFFATGGLQFTDGDLKNLLDASGGQKKP